jgi:hypothetical protein
MYGLIRTSNDQATEPAGPPGDPSVRPAITGVIRSMRWPLAALAMIAALIWPALWNGFPIVFYDTGGYLDAAMSGILSNGRSTLYGFFLRLGIPTNFWLNIVVQAGAVAWLIAATLRAHGLGGRPQLALSLTLAMAALTSLPWYAAQLMPDVLLPAGAIAVYLLAFRPGAFRLWEKALLGLIVAFAIAGHMATLALMLAITAALLLWRLLAPRWMWPQPALRYPVLAVGAGVLLILCANLLIAGRFTFTPGGENFLFGRLIETGIAKRYLADHCPDPRLRICSFRNELPDKGDDWLWDIESPLRRIGGWEKFAGEAQHIVLDSLLAYPDLHLRAAVDGAVSQFFLLKSGDDITAWTWHTHGMLETRAPQVFPSFRAARQQRTGFDFSRMNSLHVPVALGAVLSLPIIVLLSRGRRVRRSAGALALFVLLVLAGNAVICGVLSNPHARYQSRLVWLAPLALAAALAGMRRPVLAGQRSQFRRKDAQTSAAEQGA